MFHTTTTHEKVRVVICCAEVESVNHLPAEQPNLRPLYYAYVNTRLRLAIAAMTSLLCRYVRTLCVVTLEGQ